MHCVMGILIELTVSGKKGCGYIDLIRREMRKEGRTSKLAASKAATIQSLNLLDELSDDELPVMLANNLTGKNKKSL
eukprot:9689202-Ditylum_brightwellii.AAC.1